MSLDEFLPAWHFRERHQVAVRAPAEVVVRAAADLTWREVRFFRALMMKLGRAHADERIIDAFLAEAYHRLSDDAGSGTVYGMVLRVAGKGGPQALGDPAGESFRAADGAALVKVGFDFRCAGGVLSTETRALTSDRTALRRFRAYWWLVRLPGGLIRREWLAAIARRAERA